MDDDSATAGLTGRPCTRSTMPLHDHGASPPQRRDCYGVGARGLGTRRLSSNSFNAALPGSARSGRLRTLGKTAVSVGLTVTPVSGAAADPVIRFGVIVTTTSL